MTFQPGIPTGSVPLNQDYLNIQGNFTQLNTQFQVDHVPLTSTSGNPPNGYHEAIHLVPPSTTASNPPNNYPPNGVTTTGGFGQIFAPQLNDGINSDESLYFLSGGGRLTQLTRNFTPITTTNGATFLPGGLILQWGQVSAPATSGQVTFPLQFPSGAPFSIQVSLERSSGTQSVTVDNGTVNPAPTGTKFGFLTSSGGSTLLFWMAIGK